MRSKLPLLLIATGIFIPLVSLPFAQGYRRNAGVIENIQSMSVWLLPIRSAPRFEDINLLVESNAVLVDPSKPPAKDAWAPDTTSLMSPETFARVVEYGNTGIHIYFSEPTSDDDVKKVLKSGKQRIESANSKNLAFFGLMSESWPGLKLPFSFVVSGSLVLVFLGAIMLILRRPT
jgi:hypothetical protein